MKIKTLNGLRAVAVIMVLVSHAIDYFGILGNYGVTIFFVLSGFVVTQSMEKSDSLKSIYINRFVRLYPALFIFCILGTYFIDGFFGDILSYLGYSYNYKMLEGATSTKPAMVHFWSLCVEAHFYVLFPLVWFLNKNKKIFVILSAIFCFSCVSFMQSYNTWVNCSYFAINPKLSEELKNWFYFSTVPNVIPILIGSLIFYLKDQLKGLLVPAGLIIIGVFWGILVRRHFNSEYFQGFIFLGERIFISCGVFLIALYHDENEGWKWVGELLKDVVLEYIAKISYGIYLYHFIFYTLFPQNRVLAVIITIVVADMSFRFIENPISKLIKNENRHHTKHGNCDQSNSGNDKRKYLMLR